MQLKVKNQNEEDIANEILKINKITLLFGENYSFCSEIYKKIKKIAKVDLVYELNQDYVLKNQEEILSYISVNDFFSEKKIIQIKEVSDKFFKLLEIITEKLKTNKNIYFFLIAEEGFDKKSKIYKLFEKEEDLLYFEGKNFSEEFYLKKINEIFQGEKWINDEIVNYINKTITNDYFYFLNEIEKIKLYTKDKKEEINLNFFKKILEEVEEDSVFELIDAVCKKNLKVTYEKLDSLIMKGEFNLVTFIHLFFNHFYDMLYYKKDINLLKNQIYKTFRIKNYINKWSDLEIFNFIKKLKIIEKNNLEYGEDFAKIKFKELILIIS